MAEKALSYLGEKRIYSLRNHGGTILLNLVAFLLGRAGILSGLTPFGIGFYTALGYKHKKYLASGASITLGILTVQGIKGGVPYFIALALMAFTFQLVFNTRKICTITAALVGSGIYFLVASVFLIFRGFYLYDLLMITFESAAIFVTVYIASYAIPVALEKNHRRVLGSEEIICVAILMALTLSGINDINIMGVSLKNVIGILITIVFAYNGGPGVGASIGVTLGLIASMSSHAMPPIVIGIFAFSGLLAGIFKDLGKIGSGMGFLIGNSILTFYISGYYEVFIQFSEVAGAFLLFILIPVSWLRQMEKFSSPVLGSLYATKSYGEEMQHRIFEKLTDFSNTFQELAGTFENMTREIDQFGQGDLTLLLEKMAQGVCRDCGMKRTCWESNFYNTYQGLQDLLLLIETKGELTEADLPEQIRKRCIRPKAVTERMVNLYELSRTNLHWKKRMLESKELVGEQLMGIARGIGTLAKEIKNELIFDTELENSLYVALDKAGLKTKKLLVSTNEGGKMEILVERRGCNGNGDCEEEYRRVISKALGLILASKNKKCNHKDSCQFTLVEARGFRALTKAATATKEGNIISGDSFTAVDLSQEGYMVALSDGMGTGEKAHRQSTVTLNMLEKMMEAGFGKEMSIRTINSMLMLRSTEEIFSTIDLAVLDLHQGKVEFNKIGSAPSFIKRRGGAVEMIHSSSLPMGILSEIEVKEHSAQLQDGDFIILLSDGILEANQEGGEEGVLQLLREINTRNPQELADKILYHALKDATQTPEDDMTVLVTKVWRVRGLSA